MDVPPDADLLLAAGEDLLLAAAEEIIAAHGPNAVEIAARRDVYCASHLNAYAEVPATTLAAHRAATADLDAWINFDRGLGPQPT